MELRKFTGLVAAWFSIWSTGNGANILILFPNFARSIFEFHMGIARSLYSAGHNITVVHPFPNDADHKNYTFIDSSLPDKPYQSNHVPLNAALQIADFISVVLWVAEDSVKDCHYVMQKKEVQQILHSKKKQFDVMILDMVNNMFECFLPIAEELDIPTIATITTRSWRKIDWLMGNPYNPAILPMEMLSFPYKMNFRQRLSNTWFWVIDYTLYLLIYSKVEAIHRQYFPHLSNAHRRKPALQLVNTHQVFASRPLLPSTIYIGGIHVQPTSTLPQHLQKFIDEAENGVILFTLGSMLKMFPSNSTEVDIFRKVFSQVPQRVIWKSEEEIERLPPNALTSKWLPQRDILAHKNVVAFITHCGLSGILEATYEAKPLIMLPAFFDQMSNAAILEELGVGLLLDIQSLTANKLLDALNDVVNDTRYREQMRTLSKITKDVAMTPQESVVYWTEYVIRHKGAKHLQNAAADMPLYQYLLLDIILFVLAAIFVFSYLAVRIFKGTYQFFCIKLRNNENEKKFQ